MLLLPSGPSYMKRPSVPSPLRNHSFSYVTQLQQKREVENPSNTSSSFLRSNRLFRSVTWSKCSGRHHEARAGKGHSDWIGRGSFLLDGVIFLKAIEKVKLFAKITKTMHGLLNKVQGRSKIFDWVAKKHHRCFSQGENGPVSNFRLQGCATIHFQIFKFM